MDLLAKNKEYVNNLNKATKRENLRKPQFSWVKENHLAMTSENLISFCKSLKPLHMYFSTNVRTRKCQSCWFKGNHLAATSENFASICKS